MTVGKIKELLHTAPFRPFTLHLAEQTQVQEPHPDFALLTPGGILVVNTKGEQLRHIEVRLVGSVTTEADAAA